MRWEGHGPRVGTWEMYTNISFGNPKGSDSKYIIRKCGVDWIQLAQDRIQWRTLVNTVMNLRVP